MWDSPIEELAGTPFEDLVLPQLESLTINFAEETGLFDHLTTPAMRDFSFDGGSLAFPHASLTSFIIRSACPLVRLSLSSKSIPDISILVEFLTIIPTLVSLELLDIDMENALTQSLDASAAGPSLLPNLQRFTSSSHSAVHSGAISSIWQVCWPRVGDGTVSLSPTQLIKRTPFPSLGWNSPLLISLTVRVWVMREQTMK